MKRAAWVIVCAASQFLASLRPAGAQLSVTANATYTVGFDSSVAGVNSGSFAGTGFQPVPAAGQLDSDAWSVHWSPTSTLLYGGAQTTGIYAQGASNNSAVVSGGFYAFSGGNIATGVALGIQPDGSGFNAPGEDLTLRVRNNTGHFITDFEVSYLLYVRNDQGRSSKFNFSYSSDDANYTTVTSMNYTSPQTADANGFVSNSRSALISGLAIPGDRDIYLRWSCADGSGSGLRDELALDDIAVKNFVLADGILTRGDVNQDSRINAADIQAMMMALLDMNAYLASHPGMTLGQMPLVLDVDQDGSIDNRDTQALLGLLASSAAGSGQLAAVPEPPSLALFLCAAFVRGALHRPRRKRRG